MIIGKYIRRLLEERTRVILPGFGNLEVRETTGIPAGDGRLDPPGPVVRFDASYSKDDGLLASALTEGEGVDQDKATQWVLELVDAIRFALDKGEPCVIPETGTFTRDDNGKIHFRTDPQWVLEPEHYGLEPMDLLELEEEIADITPEEGSGEPLLSSEEEIPEGEVSTQGSYEDLEFTGNEEPETTQSSAEQPDQPDKPDQVVTPLYREAEPQQKRKKPSPRWKVIWIVASVLVIVLLVLIFVPFDRGGEEISGNDTETEMTTTPSLSGTESDTPEPGNEQTGAATEMEQEGMQEQEEVTAQNGGKKYYLIAGSFSHLKYASDLQDQLKEKGFTAEVLVTDNRMYRVSVASFATKEEAERELSSVKRTRGLESCWLLLE